MTLTRFAAAVAITFVTIAAMAPARAAPQWLIDQANPPLPGVALQSPPTKLQAAHPKPAPVQTGSVKKRRANS
jgi:hypothetical protein